MAFLNVVIGIPNTITFDAFFHKALKAQRMKPEIALAKATTTSLVNMSQTKGMHLSSNNYFMPAATMILFKHMAYILDSYQMTQHGGSGHITLTSASSPGSIQWHLPSSFTTPDVWPVSIVGTWRTHLCPGHARSITITTPWSVPPPPPRPPARVTFQESRAKGQPQPLRDRRPPSTPKHESHFASYGIPSGADLRL